MKYNMQHYVLYDVIFSFVNRLSKLVSSLAVHAYYEKKSAKIDVRYRISTKYLLD